MNPRDGWRLGTDTVDAKGEGFDELVIGRWFHLERMDATNFCLIVGGKMVNVRVRPDGTAKIGEWHE